MLTKQLSFPLKRDWYIYWFLFLILIRFVIDIFWWVKEINIFLSPNYWIGIIPVPIRSFYLVRERKSILKLLPSLKIFFFWSILISVNAAILLITQRDLISLNYSIKLISPVLFFFFVYNFISKKIFIRLLKLFLLQA